MWRAVRGERARVGRQTSPHFAHSCLSACHVWPGYVAPLFQLRNEQVEMPVKLKSERVQRFADGSRQHGSPGPLAWGFSVERVTRIEPAL